MRDQWHLTLQTARFEVSRINFQSPMSSRSETLTIEKTLPSVRLDTFLRGKLPAVSRGAIQRLIEEGHILVNSRKVKPTHTPRAGERKEANGPEARVPEARAERM